MHKFLWGFPIQWKNLHKSNIQSHLLRRPSVGKRAAERSVVTMVVDPSQGSVFTSSYQMKHRAIICIIVVRSFCYNKSEGQTPWTVVIIFLGANIFVSQISLFLTFVSPYVDAETMIDTFSLINLETVAKNSWKWQGRIEGAEQTSHSRCGLCRLDM